MNPGGEIRERGARPVSCLVKVLWGKSESGDPRGYSARHLLTLSLPMRPAALAVLLVASGCAASNPIELYPEFPERYARAPDARILADVMIADDVSGSADRVTVGPNVDLGRALTDSLATWMTARGYAVEATHPTVVGVYFTDPERRYRVRQKPTDARDTVATAPFALAPEVAADTLLMTALDPLGAASGMPPPQFGAYETLVALVVRGRRVPVSKSILQGVVSGVLAALIGAGASVYESSYTSVEFVMVEGETGDVIWRDVAVNRGTGSDRSVWDAVRRMVDRLPERGAEAGGLGDAEGAEPGRQANGV